MVKDTSKDYDHMLGYVAEENLNTGSLEDFLGEERAEYRPEVKKKERDPDFPEDWQKLYVNFTDINEYYKFMNEIGEKPVPKLKHVIYKQPGSDNGIFEFLE